MSTATVDSPADSAPARRGTGNSRVRTEPQQGGRRYDRSLELALDGVTTDAVEGMRAFLPNAVMRPTVGVDYVFDVLESALLVGRRTVRGLAEILENGIEAAERSAA